METTEREGTEGYGKFKVELSGGGTRTVVIPERITLADMHRVIQALFGWEDEHLWEFEDSDGRCYKAASGRRETGLFGDVKKVVAPSKAILAEVLPEAGDKLKYTYDFGDNWRHVVTRMAAPSRGGVHCARTAGPDGIENCGGAWGLQEAKRDWHVPGAGEITRRLQGLGLRPKEGAQGALSREKRRLDEILQSLTDREWVWLRTLGEHGIARLPEEGEDCGRVKELAELLPGTSREEDSWRPACLHGADGFRRFWRKHHAEWAARFGSGEEEEGAAGMGTVPVRTRDRVRAFGEAALHLYGVLVEEDLCVLAGRWREEAGWGAYGAQQLASIAMDGLRKEEFSLYSPAYFRGEKAVSLAKYPPDRPEAAHALAETLELREGKDWWHPATFREFMAWATGCPDRPEPYGRLEDFLRETWNLDSHDAVDRRLLEEIHDDVYDALAAGRGWEAAVDAMRDILDMAQLTKNEAIRLVERLLAASNETHHDANRGFTPAEMIAKVGRGDEIVLSPVHSAYFRNPNAPIVRVQAKIGRNDPCPCGSGKKFKKCCGAKADPARKA